MINHVDILKKRVHEKFPTYYKELVDGFMSLRTVSSKERHGGFILAGKVFGIAATPGSHVLNGGVFLFSDFIANIMQLCLEYENTTVNDFFVMADLPELIKQVGYRKKGLSQQEQAEYIHGFIKNHKVAARRVLTEKMALDCINELKQSSSSIPIALIDLTGDKDKIKTIYSRYDCVMARAMWLVDVPCKANKRQCFKDLALYATLIELEPSRILSVLDYHKLIQLKGRLSVAKRSDVAFELIDILKEFIDDGFVCETLGTIYPLWLIGAVNSEIVKRKKLLP